ncbi:CYTH domain-containing protein [Ruegeria sp. HKCCD8929]|uniref:CYTH domain-containing protein n=1 Tax=Ruegeria sp. HKCCD8929 TaxID=2683006 RepID=UPI00148A066B|nr:CYTH domain-containing protein [Ruegeria sp. HKCCD8929]
MNQEIERRFLVAVLPDLSAARRAQVRQGYLTRPDDSTELRLRQMDERYLLTLKDGEGLVRGEREVEITRLQFDTFWPETDGRRIVKARFTGALAGGLIFELDVFSGALAPLRMVEVEFPSEEEALSFTPPDWFGAEVTNDRRYRNRILAVEGLPV